MNLKSCSLTCLWLTSTRELWKPFVSGEWQFRSRSQFRSSNCLSFIGPYLDLSLFSRTGTAIGYFSGDVTRLIEDAQILKPTFFPSVPRVLNRIAAQIQAQADGEGLKGESKETDFLMRLPRSRARADRDSDLPSPRYLSQTPSSRSFRQDRSSRQDW